jgi:ABC-type glucose/galactose transport system permease subunit
MTDVMQIIFLALMALIIALVLWALFQTTSECYAVGGTVVRGVVWLECMK